MYNRVEVLRSSSSSSSSMSSSSSSMASLASLDDMSDVEANIETSQNAINVHHTKIRTQRKSAAISNVRQGNSEESCDAKTMLHDNNNALSNISINNAIVGNEEKCDSGNNNTTMGNNDVDKEIESCNEQNLNNSNFITAINNNNNNNNNNIVVTNNIIEDDEDKNTSNSSNVNDDNDLDSENDECKSEDDDNSSETSNYDEDDDIHQHEVDIEQCARLKLEGNALFTAGDVEGALCKYREAIGKAQVKPFTSRTTSSNTSDKNDVECKTSSNPDNEFNYTLTAQVFCNTGYCLMKLGELKDAETMFSEAIRHEEKYLKALLRRADCYYMLEKWSSAFGDFDSYEKYGGLLSAHDRHRKAVAKEKMDAEMQKMLGELKELGNRFLGNFGLSTDNFKFDKDPNTGGYSMRFERESLRK